MKPPTDNSKISSTTFSILTNDDTFTLIKNDGSFAFNEKVTYSDLLQEELLLIDSLLLKSINDYNNKKSNYLQKLKISNPDINANDYLINFENYRFQIIPVINSKGEKIAWINAFCRRYNSVSWDKNLVLVKDGGNCFFNLKINLSKKEYFDFSVNGVA